MWSTSWFPRFGTGFSKSPNLIQLEVSNNPHLHLTTIKSEVRIADRFIGYQYGYLGGLGKPLTFSLHVYVYVYVYIYIYI